VAGRLVPLGQTQGQAVLAALTPLCQAMADATENATLNDLHSAAFMSDIAVETGGCPYTAIREDASINLAAIVEMRILHSGLKLVIIESGGDNLSATFSPELADLTNYVVDVAAG